MEEGRERENGFVSCSAGSHLIHEPSYVIDKAINDDPDSSRERIVLGHLLPRVDLPRVSRHHATRRERKNRETREGGEVRALNP